jgi:hypothetical protein
MRYDKTMGEYFARLSSKYDVYAGELLQSLLTARKKGKSKCGSLSIECRSKTGNNNIFLIKRGSEVAAQFQVTTEFLMEADISPLTFANHPKKVSKPIEKEPEQIQFRQIRDLRTGMNQVNLKAKILEISKPRTVNTRYGTVATLVKALVGDETGEIQLCLWNEQAKSVSVGESIIIENARASNFGGKTQLSVGTKGKLVRECTLPVNTRADQINCS